MGFAPTPTFRSADAYERIGIALDEPFSLSRNLGAQFQQGILDSFGLGTAVRDLATPQGNVSRGTGVTSVPILGPVYEGIKSGIELFRGDQPSMSKEEYEASPYFRDAIPWEPGMTVDRAAALAGFWDLKTTRQHFAEKRPISSFIGQLAGQALDPINYIPMFGPAMQTAAIARAGSIAGRALISAGDAALNTAMFGVITREIREQFGDDVSWQAMGMEIAMSALIGGAFGGGIGVLARGRDARERAAINVATQKMDTARNMQPALVALNESIDTLAKDGEVRMSPNATEPIQRVVTEKSAPSPERQLEAASSEVVGTKAGEVVISPSGKRVAVRPEIVEMDSLQRAEGALQVRDRTTASSQAQVEDIAIKLDPARLMPNIDGSQGAPMVGPDNVVDSGNGRVMAIRRAAEAYPDRYDAYRQALADAGYDLTGFERPVLVSRRTTDLSPEARAAFNAEVNTPTTARMSAVELAQMDRSAMMSGTVLDALTDGPVTSAANRPFVDRFLNALPQNERGALVDANGRELSADGARRVENALIAAAYGDIDAGVIRRFAEATDDNTRSIVGAMSDVAGKWAQMRRSMMAGEIGPEFDPTVELTNALRMIGQWRDQAKKEGRATSTVIREGMAQIDMLTGELELETKFLIRAMFNNDHYAVAVGRDKLAARLGNIVDEAYNLGRPSLFGDDLAVTKAEMLENALAKDVETDLFAAPDAPQRAGAGERRLAGAVIGPGDQPGAAQAGPFTGGAAGVRSVIRERVAAIRGGEEADAVATMTSEFYRGLSILAGRSVDDLVDQFGLPEYRTATEAPEGALAQKPALWREGDMLGEFETERGQEGFGQALVPGVKPLTDAERMAQAAGKPLKGGEAPPAKGSLFDVEGREDAAAQMTLFQPAYHGTPHIFDKFSSDKIGTGEGAQAYGHGLYFASRKGVAEHYREALGGGKRVLLDGEEYNVNRNLPVVERALGEVEDTGSIDKALSWLAERAVAEEPGAGEAYNWLEANRDRVTVSEGGRLFEVDIPGDDELMNWDAPLSEQPPKVREFFETVAMPMRDKWKESGAWEHVKGSTLYDQLAGGRTNRSVSEGGTQRASQMLREAGIPGHRYIGNESQSTNYVIYDDSRVNVIDFEQPARGAIQFDGTRSVISLFDTADPSTALHESGHHFLKMFKTLADREDAPIAVKAQFDQVRQWWDQNADAVAKDSPMDGVTAVDVRAVLSTGTSGDAVKDLAINVGLQEQWARGFEAYAREGVAPSEGLRGAFEAFKRWLTAIYRRAVDLNVNLSPEIRSVFDTLLGATGRAETADAPRMDTSTPAPEPAPAGLAPAAAKVGKSEDLKGLAETHGIAPDYTFAEQMDVDQIREEGRLSAGDEAVLKAADEEFETADAWGRALEAAMTCVTPG